MQPCGDDDTRPRIEDGDFTGRFTAELADHPGVVHQVARSMENCDLSISSLKTEQETAPFGGTTTFRMTGAVSSAAPIDRWRLHKQLDSLERAEGIEVTFEIDEPRPPELR